jgi:hypothetical protein
VAVRGGPGSSWPGFGVASTKPSSVEAAVERCMHLVDVENLAGRGHRDPAAVAAASAEFRQTAGVAGGDLVVVGCDRTPSHRFAVSALWRGSRVVAGRGPDGADVALLAAADEERLRSGRFGTVVIGSGDRIFAPLTAALAGVGVRVVVVARPGSLAASLRDVAYEVRWLRFTVASPDALTAA